MERYYPAENRADRFLTVSKKERAVAIAIAERNSFLKKYPKYVSYQREIDRILDKAGPPEKRLAVLAMLIEGKLLEMQQNLMHLHGILVATAA